MFAYLLLAVALAETCVKYPMVLIPGILSSILEGAVNIPKDSTLDIDSDCKKTFGKKRLWVALKEINPFVNDCYIGYLVNTYNADTNTQTDMEGVTITVPDFGSTYALDSIDPNWPISLATKAFHDLIKKFEKDLGYTDGVDMLGAPYDWRYFRFDEYSHKENWYENTKNLIKKAYETNGNKQVVLISHSMGGLMTYKLLDYMGEEFTKKYVKRWVAMSGPFLGAAKTIAAAFPGNNLDLPISAAKLRPVCRRAETISFLFPTGGNANWGETPLMTIKSTGKVYTVDDMLELLGTLDDDFKKQHSYVYENGINGLYKKYNNKMPFGIETQCLISSQYETILGVTMDTPDYDTGKATLTYGDGDGTVNIQSLEYCAKLGGIVQNVGKYDHTGMLDDKASYSYLKNFICN